MSGDTSCRYSCRCHFFNMIEKNGHSAHMRELYCEKWPERCQIYQARKTAAPVPITLWPGGRL